MRGIDQALGIHPQALLLRAQRAEVLAANLANADTPKYQARDVDFRALLDDQVGQLEIHRTHPQHLGAGSEALGGAALQYRVPLQPSLDQNTVDVAYERSQFLDNALRYQASVRFLEDKLSGLLSAFRGE